MAELVTPDFSATVVRTQHAVAALLGGDPEPERALWSRRDDITLANPAGGFRRGWQEVEAGLNLAASGSACDTWRSSGPATVGRLQTPLAIPLATRDRETNASVGGGHTFAGQRCCIHSAHEANPIGGRSIASLPSTSPGVGSLNMPAQALRSCSDIGHVDSGSAARRRSWRRRCSSKVIGEYHITTAAPASSPACRRADRSSRLQRPKSRATLMPRRRARSAIAMSRPSMMSLAEDGFPMPYSASSTRLSSVEAHRVRPRTCAPRWSCRTLAGRPSGTRWAWACERSSHALAQRAREFRLRGFQRSARVAFRSWMPDRQRRALIAACARGPHATRQLRTPSGGCLQGIIL